MDNFRVKYAETTVPMNMGVVWRGENFPTPDEVLHAVKNFRESHGLPTDHNIFVSVEQRKTVNILGKTAVLPVWQEVGAELTRALMLFNEPEL
jgi:hypothetical protein